MEILWKCRVSEDFWAVSTKLCISSNFPNQGTRWSYDISYETKYSRVDQVKFVEDSFKKIWRDMVCLSRPYPFHIPSNFLKAVFQKLYLVHSWILYSILYYDVNFCLSKHFSNFSVTFYIEISCFSPEKALEITKINHSSMSET